MHSTSAGWPVALGEFFGTLPLATVLRTERAIIHIGSIDVYESAAQMHLLLTMPKGMEPPKFPLPDEMWQQMIDSGAMTRIHDSGDGETYPAQSPQREQPGLPNIRVRIAGDSDTWLDAMPRGMGGDGQNYRAEFEFMGDVRTVGLNPRLLIELPTWRNTHEWSSTQELPPFEAAWSVPLDWDRIEPAQVIDAR